MKLEFVAGTTYEKFGQNVYFALVENFSTYFVGGMVRDLLLQRKITDIDLATNASPGEIQAALARQHINFHSQHRKFAVITAYQGRYEVQITTFRQDLASTNRYPKIRLVKTPKQDSLRRDFTVNALYYSLKTRLILDFHEGLKDLQNRQLRFIGEPTKRIKEDPLRIVRALRFKTQLNFQLEKKTAAAITQNFYLLKKLSTARIETEVKRLPTTSQRKNLRKIINSYLLTQNKLML
jgi:tRNA nucleotidyltransferase/poly(A) polymerase